MKKLNFKKAREFIDILTKDFKIIRKIKFGGSFMTDAVVSSNLPLQPKVLGLKHAHESL